MRAVPDSVGVAMLGCNAAGRNFAHEKAGINYAIKQVAVADGV